MSLGTFLSRPVPAVPGQLHGPPEHRRTPISGGFRRFRAGAPLDRDRSASRGPNIHAPVGHHQRHGRRGGLPLARVDKMTVLSVSTQSIAPRVSNGGGLLSLGPGLDGPKRHARNTGWSTEHVALPLPPSDSFGIPDRSTLGNCDRGSCRPRLTHLSLIGIHHVAGALSLSPADCRGRRCISM